MSDVTAIRAAADQEVSKFEAKVSEFTTLFARRANSDRTDLICTITKEAYDNITPNSLAALFAVTVVKLTEAESKLAEEENELKYWRNR